MVTSKSKAKVKEEAKKGSTSERKNDNNKNNENININDNDNSTTTTTTSNDYSKNMSSSLFLIFTMSSLFRILIGFHPHSGQDNYHGSRKAYGGDFEAQRHWMELTYQLPLSQWYYYDLQYWGLDYPPLTAYVSYICGWCSDRLLGPESVALETSRGLEDPIHKAFMRGTVLVLDWMVYGTAVSYAQYQWYKHNNNNNNNNPMVLSKALWTLFLTLSQPAILLIDHGHFQYNTVALGLSIASFAFMVQPNFSSCIIASILFSLALNFKQMTLYYAPAIFCYLLGRCLSQPQSQSQQYDLKLFWKRFFLLGGTVIATFAVLWIPLLVVDNTNNDGNDETTFSNNTSATSAAAAAAAAANTTTQQRILHILKRIFPFERGLFEGKVANLWCALSTKPINIRQRLPQSIQPIMALGLTLMMMSPACWVMLRLGIQRERQYQYQRQQQQQEQFSLHWNSLLWATTSCALSFFLASFQVHEKSILLALAPCSLLLYQDTTFVDWFSIVCVWTLWPLLQVDRLQTAYTCMVIIYICLVWMRQNNQNYVLSLQQEQPQPQSSSSSSSSFPFMSLQFWIQTIIPIMTILAMLGLHFLELVIQNVPSHLPDLFELLWSLAGCAMFCMAWLVTCWKLLYPTTTTSSSSSLSSSRRTENHDAGTSLSSPFSSDSFSQSKMKQS